MQGRNIPQDPVWYPFTQMQDFLDHSPLSIVAAEGSWLIADDGRRYLDGVASLWANVHGHRHPKLNAAVRRQLDCVAHSTMLGLTHPGGVKLARRLVGLVPAGLSRVFYSDSGSAAVEIALKMAYQYWQLKGERQRHLFLKLDQAYHGDTVGAVSLGGMELFHERFLPLLFPTVKIPAPDLYRHPFGTDDPIVVAARYREQTEKIVRSHAPRVCGIIVEPIIQGAAGMIVHPPGHLRFLRELASELGILFIADEVAVGFGRTGRMFACQWEDVSPDLLCLGKGLSGGYLPLAATLATEEIFAAFLGEFAAMKTFFHGHTYTGNPLAVSAALASLDLFEEERSLAPEVFGPKALRYSEGMRTLAAMPAVGSVRFRGLMGGVELVADRDSRRPFPCERRTGHRVAMEARRYGVIVRPLGDVLVLMPPLSITADELDLLFGAIARAITTVCGV